MPKTYKNRFTLEIRKILLRRKGVLIHHSSVFAGVEFRGKAVIEPYCRMFGDPKITIGDNFYMNANCHLLGEITIGDDVIVGPKTIMWGRDHKKARNELIRKQPHTKMRLC